MHLNKEILRLAVPNILSGLTVPLVGLVDMYLMGQQSSQLYMGAVALGSVIFNIVYWNFNFLRVSVSGLTAQSVGEQNQNESTQVLYRALFVAIVGSLLLLLGQGVVERVSFLLLDGSPEVKSLASDYFYVRIWAAPAAIALLVFSGWFVGMQNSLYPMWIAVWVNIVNVVASYLLVNRWGMQARGVALGSVIAQYSGLLLCCILFLRKYTWVFSYFSIKEMFVAGRFKKFTNVSGDIFLRTLLIIAVFTFFTSSSAGLGNGILAANGILIQFLYFYSYFSDGFAIAAEALVGKFYGAKDKLMLNKSVKYIFLWELCIAILFTLVLISQGENILRLFTQNAEVLAIAKEFLIWLYFLPLVGFGTFLLDGIYIGVTASRQMLLTMLVSTAFFFFLPYYLLLPHVGSHAIWISMLLFMLCRSVLQAAWLKRVIRF